MRLSAIGLIPLIVAAIAVPPEISSASARIRAIAYCVCGQTTTVTRISPTGSCRLVWNSRRKALDATDRADRQPAAMSEDQQHQRADAAPKPDRRPDASRAGSSGLADGPGCPFHSPPTTKRLDSSTDGISFTSPRATNTSAAEILRFHAASVDSGHLVLRAIKSPVLNRFRYMAIRDAFHTRKIRNRPRDFQNAMIPAG